MSIRNSRFGTATFAFGLLLISTLATPVSAQNLFSPAVYVNNDAITNFEVQQRILLLKALRTPGDLQKESLDRLIGERLQKEAALAAGIRPTVEEVEAGVEEFAQRTDMSGAQFLASLADEGVAPDSFKDFVRAGLAWRDLVRGKFAANATITDSEIDRAIQNIGKQGSARVLISEIFLPTNTPENEAISLEIAPQIAALRSIDEFADAARRFSAGPSRERGGRVENWVPIENLPSQIRPLLLTMRPGQVTEPIEIPNALALFQLRSLQETTAPASSNPSLDYAAYYISGGRGETALARAARLRTQVDRCDDLYGIAKGQPPEVLDRDTLPLSEIPQDVAIELAKLDVGEVSTALTRSNGETLVFLMLCERKSDPTEISREAVTARLRSERLAGLADAYLDTLRANADIRKP